MKQFRLERQHSGSLKVFSDSEYIGYIRRGYMTVNSQKHWYWFFSAKLGTTFPRMRGETSREVERQLFAFLNN